MTDRIAMTLLVFSVKVDVRISNLDFTEWGDAFATNKMLGAATLDRLRHAAYRVVLDGESYRVPRPMPENNKSALAKGGKNKDS